MQSWLFPRPEKVLLWALFGMVVLIGGCCSPGPLRPLRPWFPPCDPTQCGQDCGEAGLCAAPDGQAQGPSEADWACQGCLPAPPLPPRCYPGPLSWLFARITWPYAPGFAGCGERYWSPWVADPPDCCDPCDYYGQWIGQQPATDYSSMYPNLFPGPIYSEDPVETESESTSGAVWGPGARQPARAACPQCGQGYQTRSGQRPGWVPLWGANRFAPNAEVCPAGYSNLAQRPRQPYRDPVAR